MLSVIEREKKEARLNLHRHDTDCQVCQLSLTRTTMIVDIHLLFLLNYVFVRVDMYIHPYMWHSNDVHLVSHTKRITDVLSD